MCPAIYAYMNVCQISCYLVDSFRNTVVSGTGHCCPCLWKQESATWKLINWTGSWAACSGLESTGSFQPELFYDWKCLHQTMSSCLCYWQCPELYGSKQIPLCLITLNPFALHNGNGILMLSFRPDSFWSIFCWNGVCGIVCLGCSNLC